MEKGASQGNTGCPEIKPPRGICEHWALLTPIPRRNIKFRGFYFRTRIGGFHIFLCDAPFFTRNEKRRVTKKYIKKFQNRVPPQRIRFFLLQLSTFFTPSIWIFLFPLGPAKHQLQYIKIAASFTKIQYKKYLGILYIHSNTNKYSTYMGAPPTNKIFFVSSNKGVSCGSKQNHSYFHFFDTPKKTIFDGTPCI